MQAFTALRSATFSSPSRAAFAIPRIQLDSSKRRFFCQAKFAESRNYGSVSLRLVHPNLLAAQKKEAKAVLTLFLKKQGLSNAVAARAINKSELFIDHLVSRLHSVNKSRYLVGRELTTLEIRDAHNTYLETLLEECGNILVHVVENFSNLPIEDGLSENIPTLPVEEKVASVVSCPKTTANWRKTKALSRVTKAGPDGKLPPNIIYLTELGMKLETIKEVTRKFPGFAYYSLEGKVKPIVEFFLGFGISKSDIPSILSKRPQFCAVSLSETLKPSMTFLENLGVDKKQGAKFFYRFSELLTCSRQKLKATVNFLYEMGLSSENVGKVLTHFPNVINYSVEENLRPTAEYFGAMGVDVAVLLLRSPQTFGLSIEANLRPVTEFFLEKGYSKEDVAIMISRYKALYTLSLAGNLVPKWEFFLTMDYPKSELIKFPHYFGYSLEGRIKPRYAIVQESGVKLFLSQVLCVSDGKFDEVLKRKMKKNCR